ncbi:MAG: molybdopterin-dependent oxidoreductase, partial [Eggerthellaceae bacterium]|nr:molybdopterin-dependent oxidoreductase [Eggerthellaceae bacterium]
ALDEIAAQLTEIQEKYGPESVAVWSQTSAAPPSMGLLASMTKRFTAAIRATDPMNGVGLDNGAEFSNQTDLGGGYMMVDPAWMQDSDLILVWGANPIENQHRIANCMVEARSRGAKIYDIGLVHDATAGFSDWFIPVKPGSDAALALAVAKVIVDDEAYNRDFVVNKTVAPLLVETKTGKFHRSEDGYFYYAWDCAKNEPVQVAPSQYDLDLETTALNGCFTVDGVECKTAFQLLKERLEEYTPEYSEQITGVPAQDCIDLAHEIEKSKAIFYNIAYGLRYKNQGEIHRAVTLLSALTGSNGYPGAGCGYSMATTSWPVPYNTSEVDAPYGRDEKGMPIGPVFVKQREFFNDCKAGKYKAFLKMQGNPVHNNPNRARYEKDTFPNMELVVDFDIWMTDTSELADYVLPDCMPFERLDFINPACYGHVVLQEPAIEPVGDNKPATWYISELAKRLGLGDLFDKTDEQWIEKILDDSPSLINEDGSKITLEQLRRDKLVRPASLPKTLFNGSVMGITTPSGRVEFYAEAYAPLDEAIPKYRPSLAFPIAEDAKYPYQFFTGRQRFFMQSMFTDDPLMRELSGGEPLCRMNPVDAEREGLVVGDTIEVYNDNGSVQLKLVLDEAVPPGTVHVWFGWRRRAFEKGTYAELTVPCGGEEASDELSDLWWDHFLETGNQLGSWNSFITGTWDTLWDATCAVRKL